ncbi:hypothetical protein [Clostridium nigeriense]|uniref:hypothetical protein n=1 Tax=Clostridium nigeriense TaxID=1805470 RepID=UPI0008370898|nr:hypothetical protein [Clostridium nigeriense]
MKNNKMKMVLITYDLFLALGAIYEGFRMVLGRYGEYPPEWLGRVPFKSWVIPGIIAILFYGLGNLLAGVSTFIGGKKGIIITFIMGIIFLVSLLISIRVLGDIYLATGEFIILSVIQILLSIITFIVYRSRENGLV